MTTLRTRAGRLLAALIGLAMIAAACGNDDDGTTATTAEGGTATTGGEAADGGVITIAASQELTSFNISTSADNLFWGNLVVQLIWPSAYEVLPDYSLRPQVLDGPAEIISEDPFTVRWTIKEEAVWDDGTPVSADDFEYYWRSCNGKIDEGEPTVVDEESGEEVTAIDCASTAGYDLIEEFTKVDDKTVEAVFSDIYVDYEGLFGLLVPAHIAAERGPDAWNTGFKDDPGASAGPYTLEEWVKGESLTLVRNENYWGPPAKTERLVFRFIEDDSQQPDALRNGEVDVIYPQPQVDLVDAVRDIDTAEFTISFGPTWEHLTFNVANPHLALPEVRRAIAMATDRDAIVEALMGPFSSEAEKLGNHVYVQGQNYYVDNTPEDLQARDVDGAKALLEEAGYTLNADGVYEKDGEELVVRISTTGGNPRRERLQELLINQWAEAGIKGETYNLPGADVFSQRIFAPERDFDVAIFAWVGSVFPASGTDQIFSCGSESNPGGYCNEDVDALLEQVLSELDPDRRAELLNQIDVILWEDLPNLPMYQLPTFAAWNTAVSGVQDNPTTAGITWNAYEWEKA